jgi:general secretion pathway protein E
MEMLTEWLADKTGLTYLRIDPLRIDVPSVTAVVSHAYASRLKILPVEITDDTVVFATSIHTQKIG